MAWVKRRCRGLQLMLSSCLLLEVTHKQDLEQLLGCHVDVVEEEGLSRYLRQRVVEVAPVL